MMELLCCTRGKDTPLAFSPRGGPPLAFSTDGVVVLHKRQGKRGGTLVLAGLGFREYWQL